MYDENKIVGFAGILHQPHGVNKKIKRVSRIVILPDYQGIGLGYKFLNFLAKYYSEQGYDFSIVTSAKNFIYKLYNSPKWQLRRLGFSKNSSTKSKIDYNRKSMRTKCKTASFFYIQNR
nr:MAG TPA: acetyltransferase domain containing protein [Caudoviricetes sp.]